LKYRKSILVGLCLFGLSIAAWSQNVNSSSVPGIPGYLDPRNGTFKPMPRVTDLGVASGAPASLTVYNGFFGLSLVAYVYSALPGTETYSCTLSATVYDTGTQMSFTETATVAATKSGPHVSCSVTIPYYWKLSSNTDVVSLSYQVNATNGAGGLPLRMADHSLPSITVPSPGGTTSFSDYLYL
jgi:hypothetical protein